MFVQLHAHELEHVASMFGHYFVWLMFFCSLGFYGAATLAALRFSRRGKKTANFEFTPQVSVLKPVHGTDFGSAENFASFCTQNYPHYEVLFAVDDEDDPAVPLIKKLTAAHPEREIRLVTGAPFVG